MRIAISGTHCSGKSTLIDDFIAIHRDYVHEPEPYEWLEDNFTSEPTGDDFHRQLELSVERLQNYTRGARMIAERSPLDFLAYLLALGDLDRRERDEERIADAAGLAAAGLAHLDLLVILPLRAADGITAPESENLELRDAMNDHLLDLIAADPYSLFASGRPRIVEISGTPAERLHSLEQAIAASR